jgi:hypothetical protein
MKLETIIKTGSILTATSVCDSNCKWTATVIERKGNFVTALIDGKTVRKKVNVWQDEEYVFLLGKYSMAPIFMIAK